MFDWNDIRLFLAVAAEGSTLAASRKLGLNQTTVGRRVQALEQALRLTLFERDTRGYQLTPQGSALLDLAGQMQATAETLAVRAERLARDVAGLIRITGAGEAMNQWGFPVLARFRKKFPDVEFEVDVSKGRVDLEAGEADVAFRATDAVEGDTLVARKLARIPWGVYCNRAYHRARGAPRSIEEAAGHPFLLYDRGLTDKIAAVRWLDETVPAEDVAFRVNSVEGMAGSLRSGSYLGLLPCVSGDTNPDLVPCFRHEALVHTLWIVASREAYAQARVRAFMRFVGDNFPHSDLWEPL
ncbi:LysR family transcriptional regulator [Jannaschia sp. W003]|uniref:LysR family transcriptional regulator n=1 Tax=Jannaschia sp. W003 TaxID=2867012 RepID=UPI0021A64C6F|nr:LysR family transcriptional regulator [Jannaschia sp. W003]UWQ20109.1 LysR family transcriptional regulator [Jannaschia sp. W003]